MMRWHRFALFAFFLAVFASLLSAQPAPKREFRGAWIATVTNIDWPSSSGMSPQGQRSQLTAILDQLAVAGMNAVIFQVRPECDAFYNSPYEPWSYWLTGTQGTPPSDGYDPLQFAVQEAHKRGMEIHAWFNPYRAQRTILNSYPLSPNHVVVRHPEWALKIGDYRLLNPGLRVVRDYVAMIVADVVRRYDVDGAHMDDYFYQEGITTEDSAAFRADPRGFTNVGDWRRDNVNLLIRQINDSVKAVKPYVKWGISPRGIWKNGVPAGISGADNYSVIYCDAVAWLSGQYIDYIAPQLYWPIGGPQDYSLLMPWWASQANGRHLYTGNAAYRIGSFGPASEMANQIKLNRGNPQTQGNIQFSTSSILRNLGGFTDLLKADLYHSAAIIPTMSWKNVVPPEAPQNNRYTFNTSTNLFELQWNSPSAAADGDTAARYVVYRFKNATIQPGDLEDSRNILSLTGQPGIVPSPRIDTPSVRYYYAVTALDRNNNESSVSNTVSFESLIAAPVLTYPVDKEQYFPQGGPLSWTAPTSSLIHQLQVAKAPDFSPPSLVKNLATTNTDFSTSGLAASTTYYWRVMSGNQAQASSYSEIRSFRTGWPAPPTLVAPLGVRNVSRTPTFVWMKSEGTSFRLRVTDYVTKIVVIDTTVSDSTVTSGRILAASRIHRWVVSASNAYGAGDWSTEGSFQTEAATLVERDGSTPREFALSQNYPNPFNPTTNFEFRIANFEFVMLKVYDILGREVATLVDEELKPGKYTVRWDASELPSGVYFYRLVASGYVATKRMQLIK